MKKLSSIDMTAVLLTAVGGLNWGLVGVFEYDLVSTIFGEGSALTRVVFSLVGLAAVYVLVIGLRLRKEE